jgi:hypothetical protein
LAESRTFSTLLYAGFSQPHARTPPGGATVHGVSDNEEADNIAEIAGENTRSRYIYSGKSNNNKVFYITSTIIYSTNFTELITLI